MSLARFVCPRCGHSVEALAAAEVVHECPKRNNRPTLYQRTTDEGDMTMPATNRKPSTTRNTIGRGNAPRQAARQKAKVQESADKLAALKARQDGEPEPPAEPAATVEPGVVVNMGAAKRAEEPTVQFVVDGKPVGRSQNRLSSISRVTATADTPRWPAPEFRSWLSEQGVTDPNHTEWEVTLPNGRKIAAVATAG